LEYAVNPIFFLEDDTMEIAEQFTAQRPIKNLEVRNLEVKNYDMSIILGYSIFATLFLIALYFDSMSPGTTPDDFASMTVTPQFEPRSALAGPVRNAWHLLRSSLRSPA
jgi:hypothetical protein